MLRKAVIVVVMVALVLGSVACSTASPQPKAKQLEKVTVAYATPSSLFAPVWVAKDAGLFEKYGLDADLTYIAGAPVLMPAVINGEVNFGQTAAPAPMNSYLEGGGTVWITAAVHKTVLYLMADPSIKKVQDLKGKAIGVTRIGSTTDLFAKYALQKHGVEPNKDVAILATGGTPETLAALQTGKIQAAIMGPPNNIQAEKAGYKKIYDLTALDIPYPMSGALATKSFIKQRPETVKNFVKAYVEAIHLLRTDAKLSKEVIGKYTKTEGATLDATYNAYAPFFEEVPLPSARLMKAALEGMAETNPKAKTADAKEFYDDTFVKELDQSGFIKKLYEKK